MKAFKRWKFLLFFVLIFCAPLSVSAYAAEKGATVYVSKDRTIDGNFYAAGNSIVVDGHVTGDLICAGQNISVTGRVDGDVICVGQNLFVGGEVGGNVRLAGNGVRLNAKVARNFYAAGASIDVDKDASIGWDALVAGADAQIRGEIGRSLLGAGASFFLNGKVGNDVRLYLDGNKKNTLSGLNVAESAVINGKLEYNAINEAKISEKAQIGGEKLRYAPKFDIDKKERKVSRGSGIFGFALMSALTALVLAYVLLSFVRKPVLEMADKMKDNFGSYLGWGLLWLIAIPFMAFILLISFFGIRLAALLMLFYGLILIVAKTTTAIAVGRFVLKKYKADKADSIAWLVFAGVALSWLVFSIPFVGWVISMMACWCGAGAWLIYLKEVYKKNN